MLKNEQNHESIVIYSFLQHLSSHSCFPSSRSHTHIDYSNSWVAILNTEYSLHAQIGNFNFNLTTKHNANKNEWAILRSTVAGSLEPWERILWEWSLFSDCHLQEFINDCKMQQMLTPSLPLSYSLSYSLTLSLFYSFSHIIRLIFILFLESHIHFYWI